MPRRRGGEAGQSGCVARTKGGAPCRSFSLRGRDWCIAHDPDGAGTARAARAKGGATASKIRALKGRRSKLDTAPALVAFTAGVIHDALGGTLEPDLARVVLYGISIQRQLVETSDLDKRLTSLEDQTSAGGPRRGHGRW